MQQEPEGRLLSETEDHKQTTAPNDKGNQRGPENKDACTNNTDRKLAEKCCAGLWAILWSTGKHQGPEKLQRPCGESVVQELEAPKSERNSHELATIYAHRRCLSPAPPDMP